MKKLILCMVLLTGIMSAQSFVTFEQMYRDDGSGANGSTWADGVTHYTNFQDMTDADSAWIVANFPDSVNCAFYVMNYAGEKGVSATSAIVNTDSLQYTTDETGISACYSLVGFYDQGYPVIKIKTVFSDGGGNTLVLSKKYKLFIKKFKHY
jgi:hypothetical protein